MTRFLAEQLSTAHWFDQRRTRPTCGGRPRSPSTRGSGGSPPGIASTSPDQSAGGGAAEVRSTSTTGAGSNQGSAGFPVSSSSSTRAAAHPAPLGY